MKVSVKDFYVVKDRPTLLGLDEKSSLTYTSNFDSTVVDLIKRKQLELSSSPCTQFGKGHLDFDRTSAYKYLGGSSSGSSLDIL